MLFLVFIIAAIICFFLAALNVPFKRINLVALGLALWALATIFSRF
jgi:hypothetical protein